MRRTAALLLAIVGLLAAGVAAWRWSAARETIVDEIAAGRRTTPIIGPRLPDGGATVTFFARAMDGRAPRVVSDVTGWGERIDGTFDYSAGTMTRLGQSNWYSLAAPVVAGARIEYLLAYAPGDTRPDPYNPRRSPGPQMGGAPASEFVMPDYVVPPEFVVPASVPAGTVAEEGIEAPMLGGRYRVLVHTAVGAPSSGAPLVVVLDGRVAHVARIIDGLVARRQMAPGVTLFLTPETSDGSPQPEESLRRFLTHDVPAWAAAHHGTSTRPGQCAIAAVSFGAKDALFAALQGGAYDRLALWIPGRRLSADDIARVAGSGYPGSRLTVTILGGRYDHANVPTARGLRDALSATGHQVDYVEVPEGHSAVTWITHAGQVLASVMR
jgi:enterochelin esterase-like enzyme